MHKAESTKPKLIVVAGCAASGKTTIGRMVAQRLGAVYLDKDDATRRFTDLALQLGGSSPQDREGDFYIEVVRPVEYETMFAIARTNLALGNDVVVTAPFIHVIANYEGWRDASYPESGDEYDVALVWIAHDIELEHARMMERAAARDGSKLEHWDEYAESVAPLSPDERYGAIIVENLEGSDPSEAANLIIARL